MFGADTWVKHLVALPVIVQFHSAIVSPVGIPKGLNSQRKDTPECSSPNRRSMTRSMVLRVPERLTELRPQTGILDRNSLVDSGMGGNIRSVVRERAEGKGVLVGVLALLQQLANEVSAAFYSILFR
jgi:hypothetical protein